MNEQNNQNTPDYQGGANNQADPNYQGAPNYQADQNYQGAPNYQADPNYQGAPNYQADPNYQGTPNEYQQQYQNYNQQYPQQPIIYQQPPMPEEFKKWNWGAFMFSIWWGIGNKAYMALLCFVPLLSIVWVFICGAKGNEWAWKAGNFSDPKLFAATQDSWNRAGKVAFIIALSIAALYILIFIIIGCTAATSLSSGRYYSYY